MQDLISRQAIIKSIRECAEVAHGNHEWDMEQGYLNAIECIKEEPSAQPEQKRGHWIVTDIPNLTSTAQDVVTFTRQCRCSECGALFGRKSDNYCYNCGARMDGGKEDE